MKFEKYITKTGQIRWRFYHYFGLNEDTGKADEIKKNRDIKLNLKLGLHC